MGELLRRLSLVPLLLLAAAPAPAAAPASDQGIAIPTPGLAPSRLDAEGRLVEDWGAVKPVLDGEGLGAAGPVKVEPAKVDGLIPAVRAASRQGPLSIELTAFRAPVWPAGVDVLSVRIEETEGKEVAARLSLDLPPGIQVGARSASLGGRAVLAIPPRPLSDEKLREWGYCDEATPLSGWASPEGPCDPAFRNIRAGLGGVPILYRFSVEPRSAASVVLGLCESHWAQPGQRPIICKVEGAPPQEVDPIARWGRHKPGALLFPARDADGDGRLEVAVLPKPGAPDQNPILNVIWIFPQGQALDLGQVAAGKLNQLATRYVDAGGEKDQSIYPPGKIEYPLKIKPRGVETLTFLAACPGGSVPLPERSAWSPESLLLAAKAVWKDWK